MTRMVLRLLITESKFSTFYKFLENFSKIESNEIYSLLRTYAPINNLHIIIRKVWLIHDGIRDLWYRDILYLLFVVANDWMLNEYWCQKNLLESWKIFVKKKSIKKDS